MDLDTITAEVEHLRRIARRDRGSAAEKLCALFGDTSPGKVRLVRAALDGAEQAGRDEGDKAIAMIERAARDARHLLEQGQ